MAAIAQQPATPRQGRFAFLKNGALLPVHRCRPFMQLCGLMAGGYGALFLLRSLAVQPLAAVDDLDAYATDHPWFSLWLLLAGAMYVVSYTVVKSAIKIATVTLCSGERPTLASFLDRVKGSLWGSVVTAVFVFVLQLVCYSAMVMFFALLFSNGYQHQSYLALFLCMLLLFVALSSSFYLEVVCKVAVVVSAAEPGRRGASAVGRAWRLVRGKKTQSALCVAATWALGRVVSPVCALAMMLGRTVMPVYALTIMGFPPHGAADGILQLSVVGLLLCAVEVLVVAIVTAYYLECRAKRRRRCQLS